MAASPDTLLQVATGGKENDLKLWDGNRLAAPIFQAKNVSILHIILYHHANTLTGVDYQDLFVLLLL